jgi:hypothetical protein
MPIDLQHKIRFIIKFKEPVDLFNVIYKLKISTRIDFIANKYDDKNELVKEIILIDKIPNETDGDFFQTYEKFWNDHSNYFSFNCI